MQSKGGDGGDSSDENDSNNENIHDRNGRGRFSPAVSLGEILEYLEAHRGASTGELAEAFDVSAQTIRRKCDTLVECGEVRAREAGRTTFWQLTLNSGDET